MRNRRRHRDNRTYLSPLRESLAGLLLIMGLLAAAVTSAQSLPAPVLEWDMGDAATGGYYRLSWRMPEGVLAEDARPVYELQLAETRAFDHPRLVYEGGDTARVISGQPDGVAYFRVRVRLGERTSPWSEVLAAKVEHHPLGRAFLFFGVGAVVFVTTLVFIIGASRRAKHRAGAHG